MLCAPVIFCALIFSGLAVFQPAVGNDTAAGEMWELDGDGVYPESAPGSNERGEVIMMTENGAVHAGGYRAVFVQISGDDLPQGELPLHIPAVLIKSIPELSEYMNHLESTGSAIGYPQALSAAQNYDFSFFENNELMILVASGGDTEPRISAVKTDGVVLWVEIEHTSEEKDTAAWIIFIELDKPATGGNVAADAWYID